MPLEPTGLAARGGAALTVARRLLQLDNETLGKLQGLAGDNLLLVCGPVALLPWADGVIYLGSDSQVPLLLLPTTQTPSLPLALVQNALHQKVMQVQGDRPGELSFAVLPQMDLLIPLTDMRKLGREGLRRWLEANQEAV